jgi:hypothetical protein
MKPEDRADAETLWRLYGTLADTSVRLMTAPHPSVTTEVLTISAPAMLLLTRERQYWHDLAQSRGAPVDQIAPKAAAAATAHSPAPAAPAVITDPRARSATAERVALLHDLWPRQDLTLPAIAKRLNALPGPAISHPTVIYGWAKRLGLRIPRQDTQIAVRVETHAEPDAPPPAAPSAPVVEERAPQLPACPPLAPVTPPPDLQPASAAPPAAPPSAAPRAAPAAPTGTTPRKPIRPDDIWDEAREMLQAKLPIITIAAETGLTVGQVRDLRFGLTKPAADKGAA